MGPDLVGGNKQDASPVGVHVIEDEPNCICGEGLEPGFDSRRKLSISEIMGWQMRQAYGLRSSGACGDCLGLRGRWRQQAG
jgi:hypothetical protein